MQTVYCRYAPSLGALEGTPEEVWGTPEYIYSLHKNKPMVAFGLYDFRDYFALWRHRGKRYVLWAGSDILNLENNFLLNDGKLKTISRLLKWFPRILDRWLVDNVEHWVENEVEKCTLARLGIYSRTCPSFMGEKKNYRVEYVWSSNPKAYISASPSRQKEYGWDIIERIADKLPMVTFHLYGAPWITHQKNIIVHGRVPKEQMNEEIKKMQCGLRLNSFDGFSEITAKSVLWGQYPITNIYNPLIPFYRNDNDLISYLRSLTLMQEPNHKARNHYMKKLNAYPFNNFLNYV